MQTNTPLDSTYNMSGVIIYFQTLFKILDPTKQEL